MASLLGGLLGGLSEASNILSQAFSVAREVGRVTFDIGVRIFDFFSDPKKGILFSIAVVKLTDLINIDVQQIVESIDSIADMLENIDWDQIIRPITINMESIVDEARTILPITDCGSPPNPILDPAGAFAWVSCNIANSFKIIGQGIYILARVLELGLLFVLRELAVLIGRGLASLASLFLRYVIKPFVFAIVSALAYLKDKIRWACCEYLKFSHFLIMARMGYDILSRSDKSILKGITRTFAGALLTIMIVSALVPECSPQISPSPPPGTQPIVIGYPTTSLMARSYELTYNRAQVIKTGISKTVNDYVNVYDTGSITVTRMTLATAYDIVRSYENIEISVGRFAVASDYTNIFEGVVTQLITAYGSASIATDYLNTYNRVSISASSPTEANDYISIYESVVVGEPDIVGSIALLSDSEETLSASNALVSGRIAIGEETIETISAYKSTP
ncbi:MAG: hypothetical protein QXH51_07475 [Candidatus Bathyarchaeia archaeon]